MSRSTLMKIPANVKIEENGAIVIGQYSIDGCAYKPVRIVSHAHQDHIGGLSKSYRHSSLVVATPETFAILRGLDFSVNNSKSLPLKYNTRVEILDSFLTFRKMNHIPGTAGVEIETSGTRIAYTSDFRLEGSYVFEGVDILIIDATYGHPSHKRTWSRMHIVNKIINMLEENGGSIWVYGYYGKIQGFMLLMREAGFKGPFILTKKMYEVTRELEHAGLFFGEYYLYGTPGAREALEGSESVVFDHANNFRFRKQRNGIQILLTGWASRPIEVINDRVYRMSYSDHADYYDTLEYVRRAKPKMVIVDSSRSEYARFMARAISNTLNIHSVALP